MRGKISLKLGGEKRQFKFTLSTFKRYDDEKGIEGASIQVLDNPLKATLELGIYAIDYPGNENNLGEDFSEEVFSDWVDDLNEKDLDQLIKTMIHSVKKYSDALTKAMGLTQEDLNKMVQDYSGGKK